MRNHRSCCLTSASQLCSVPRARCVRSCRMWLFAGVLQCMSRRHKAVFVLCAAGPASSGGTCQRSPTDRHMVLWCQPGIADNSREHKAHTDTHICPHSYIHGLHADTQIHSPLLALFAVNMDGWMDGWVDRNLEWEVCVWFMPESAVSSGMNKVLDVAGEEGLQSSWFLFCFVV